MPQARLRTHYRCGFVGVNAQAADAPPVADQRPEQATGGHAPELDRLIRAARGDQAAPRPDAHRGDRAAMTAKDAQASPGGYAPEPNRRIVAT